MWGRSIQEKGSDVVIGRSIYRVVVTDGSLYSRFYGSLTNQTLCSTGLIVFSMRHTEGRVSGNFSVTLEC